MSDKPVSPLRRRMIEDMTVRNFVEKTRNDYIRHVPLTSSLHRRHWLRSARSALPRSGFVLWTQSGHPYRIERK
jgi:hypothetical protein